MFGPVITTEAHLAFSGARTHSNNTAEMTAMIGALSFLGPHGQVARDVESCVYYDSKHVAGVSLVTIQARTHVQLALACQRSRLTMQHVYGHTGNLGNECADHAAALGSLDLISSHNVATRWVRHNFDTSAYCETSLPQDGVSAVFTIGFSVSLTCTYVSSVILLSAFFPAHPLCSSGKAMESPTSSVFTASSFGEKFAHNLRNPFLELVFHELTSGIFVLCVEEIDLAKTALSCHFALDLLCYKEGGHDDCE